MPFETSKSKAPLSVAFPPLVRDELERVLQFAPDLWIEVLAIDRRTLALHTALRCVIDLTVTLIEGQRDQRTSRKRADELEAVLVRLDGALDASRRP